VDLFTYGALMLPDIMAKVAGCRPAAAPATLAGYRRTLVRDEDYPGIAEDERDEVAGSSISTCRMRRSAVSMPSRARCMTGGRWWSRSKVGLPGRS